jgi:catechol 2,3-dioxygenase-like lactoylglutathione lyase family enzyme
MSFLISGIQQIGVGVPDADAAFEWYANVFGANVPIFKEAASAPLMTPYTGGEVRDRYAILAINMKGGGGFEIWQYTSRVPQPADFKIEAGDLGIFTGKIKTDTLENAYTAFHQKGLVLSEIGQVNEQGPRHFFAKDLYGNVYDVVESDDMFQQLSKGKAAGVAGAILGVSDIERALPLYQQLLGYDTIVYDESGQFPDLAGLPGGKGGFRRVLLQHKQLREGAFAPMFGKTEIELIQALDRQPRKIFKDRFWGDLGFIHLCFDVRRMDDLKKKAQEMGYPFTVDSGNSFDMGEAAGRFAYIEDPDGTLIEFVETHKVPILKKIGWYLNLNGGRGDRALPRWLLKAMKWGKKCPPIKV